MRSRFGKRGSIVPAALSLALGLVGCEAQQTRAIKAGQSPSAPTTTALNSPSPSPSRVAVSQRLASPPRNCGKPSPLPTKVAPLYGPLVGKRPVWAGVYASLDKERGAYHAEDATRTRFGWRVKFLWVVGPSGTEVVELSGFNLRTGDQIWFEISDDGGPALSAVLDPAAPGAVSEPGSPLKEFPSYLYFPRAGCYLLRVESGDAGWVLRFGLGT